MKKLRLFVCFLAFAASLLAFLPVAQAQQSTPAPIGSSKNVPLPAMPLAPIATQLGQTLQTLVGTTSTAPAPATTTAPDSTEDSFGQITDTFATGILDTLVKAVESLKANSTTLATTTSAWPDFSDWLVRQSNDPRHVALWSAIGNDLLIVIGVPLLVCFALMLFLLPLRLRLKRNHPRDLPGRVGVLVSLFLLRIVPIVVFLGLSLLLLDQNETHRLPRFFILNIIYALSLGYALQQILRSIFAPTAAHLRPFTMTTPSAISSCRWFSAFSFTIVYSYFLIDLSTAVRVPASTITFLQNLFALILTGMAITVIIRTRTRVASILRGPIEDEDETPPSFTRAGRVWFAWHWHSLAIVYLVISLAVTLLGIDNGFALMLRGTIFSVVILAAARFGFIVLDKWKAPSSNGSVLAHRQFLSFLLRPAIWLSAAVGIAVTWGVRFDKLLATPSGQHIVGALLSIGLTLLILTVLYELINSSIERHINRRDKVTKQPIASARALTLLPMVRHSIFILFCAVALLTCLSAVGINIAPLLAGAGVLGVALGFGSQTLVKDFLTGLFIVVENTIAVGDIVTIAGFSGVVEALSIRTIRLRDVDGSLHIVPFSEVLKITNMSKGFAYALADIEVAYDSDLEHVMNVLREIGADLQEDPVFKRVILEPIEVMGVEKLGASSITIRARIRTRPGKQGDVRRLLLLRVMQRFNKENIVIPFPTITHINQSASEKPKETIQKPVGETANTPALPTATPSDKSLS